VSRKSLITWMLAAPLLAWSATTPDGPVTSKMIGGHLYLTRGGVTRHGCLKMRKSTREGSTWKADQTWAQGISAITHPGDGSATLSLNLGWALQRALPDHLEKIKLSAEDLAAIHHKWLSGNYFVREIFAKGNSKVRAESEADTRLQVFFGGDDVNRYCKAQWAD